MNKLITILVLSLYTNLFGFDNSQMIKDKLENSNIHINKILETHSGKVGPKTEDIIIVRSIMSIKDINKSYIIQPWENVWGCIEQEDGKYFTISFIQKNKVFINLDCDSLYNANVENFQLHVVNSKKNLKDLMKNNYSKETIKFITNNGDYLYLIWDGKEYKGIRPYSDAP